MSQIEIKNVSVTFKAKQKDIHAVSGVSLSIQKGEVFGIVGLSGAGKSTLVRTINGLQQPTTGEVTVDGVNITKASKPQLAAARQKMGFIFQNFNLVNNRTIAQNIGFALTAANYQKDQQAQRIEELLGMVGLADRKDNYPEQLSGGQKQRVGIARALANNPDILLCDEATSALDTETAEEIVTILKDINTRLHITIVFITHQLEVAKSLFNRVAVMEDGRIVEQTTVYDLFADPKSQMGQRLVGTFLDTKLPDEVLFKLKQLSGQLLSLRYQGEDSLDPIITKIAKATGVEVNILQGRIEYIQNKAIGILAVFLTGDAPNITQAITAFKQAVDQVSEVAL
ncbi:ABC transporter, ATP-binding protein [Agrilactobacillus composti DSM 18527 = JCM 14202]|uniref:ABC transporter, ATP-binding protein n=1 Tax=Agrilactobacillus composti DSM 18527 = JCM 14202 TaxID=1423734 RepID=X0PF60_9LACO|nr:ATP-binding cassette domain-containing protein [Agrilactobacillus composti]KRM35086.1 ABC transporter, ATP-binding protein [Agrilactobacillus composti DSM 18527 = JCM 14202]GAF40469.1 methionine ABC transporter ATP-binding protein [Agrilactobacillus composti DSM 18527 = JCM 14202]